MKIQHWAIIFIILVLPLSIMCRSMISKKNLNLRDEIRYNNVIDNATFDAVSQIVEVSEELGYGKNVPITEGVAMAAIERFFNSLSVNFNLPINLKNAEAYFGQYVPAILIVGYDGLYVYSCEETSHGYEFKLKPKIPYACTYQNGSANVVINFTLDNYVTMYFPNDTFQVGIPNEVGNTTGTHIISGYIGEILDIDQNGVDDRNDMLSVDGFLVEWDGVNTADLYVDNDDPFALSETANGALLSEYILSQLPTYTNNLSYILEELAKTSTAAGNRAKNLSFLYAEDANKDYGYNEDRFANEEASEFHKLRRETIINLITAVMREEFNEHNDYAKNMGITYNFNVPDIARDQWNNTIDDISVLAFMQGMPMGADTYYNNYSLGGTRIVRANYLYAETVNGYKIYHKHYCPLIPKDGEEIIYSEGSTFQNGNLPSGTPRVTTGIEEIFINADHAKEAGYYICSECM